VNALQVPLVCFAAFENHFCGHQQECARIHRKTFSPDNSLKLSEELASVACMDLILGLTLEDLKMTGECYRQSALNQWVIPLIAFCGRSREMEAL
jgi:hypothetical protein